MSSARIGIDTGGTFTDCVLADEKNARLTVLKVPSDPADPSNAIVAGLIELSVRSGVPLHEVSAVAHGTTVATNAMLEGKWGRVGLITTRGFRDVLEIGTQMRPQLYALQSSKPEPLVPRDLVIELDERTAADGSVVEVLDPEAAEGAVRRLVDAGVECIVVSLLFSFANDTHERMVEQIVRRVAPDLYVCRSSVVAPVIREFPRTSTAVINAALAPVVTTYMNNLVDKLADHDLGQRLTVMQSHGGVMRGADAAGAAHNLILSGPAGGVIAAAAFARAKGADHVLTFDMGGTSTDVGLIVDGEARQRFGTVVADAYPLSVPLLDLHTVGAGGGSIAYVDVAGALKVGPRSAGAVPGPAAYGLGGTEPTVTDANLVLGRIDPDYYLGGEFYVDVDAARAAVASVAGPLGMSVEEAALGIIEIADANMVGALRVVSSRRGLDPRDFALVPFGGAGSLHAAAVGRQLGMRTALIPAHPGALSAIGILASDVRYAAMKPVMAVLSPTLVPTVAAALEALEADLAARFDEDGRDAIVFVRELDLRYVGQDFALTVPIGAATEGDLARAAESFHALHERTYGYSAPDEQVELVNVRAQAVMHTAPLPESVATTVADTEARTRSVYFRGHGWTTTPVRHRASLQIDVDIPGPMIIDQPDTTILVEPGDVARRDAAGDILLTIGADR